MTNKKGIMIGNLFSHITYKFNFIASNFVQEIISVVSAMSDLLLAKSESMLLNPVNIEG